MLHSAIVKGYEVLESGVGIDFVLAQELMALEGEDILDLMSLANKVRFRFSKETHACSIVNAKSGVCPQNCKFCAQSAHHNSEVEVYGLSADKILAEAKRCHESGISHFGIVTSGTGYMELNAEFQTILDTIDKIKEQFPGMKICCSLGLLGEEPVKLLAEKGIGHYNINLQVNPERFAELIADTHEIRQKIETIKLLQKYGVSVCCGGILGVAEDREDRVKLAFACKDLGVTVIPLNVLVPIAGTPLESQPTLPVSEITKTFAIFRLVNPKLIIKFAAGRETVMKDFQGLLMLAGANGLLTGGYLTTRGRKVEDDTKFIKQLEGFHA